MTMTREARMALMQAKETLGCDTISEAVIKMSMIVSYIHSVLNEKRKQRTRQRADYRPKPSITIYIPAGGETESEGQGDSDELL